MPNYSSIKPHACLLGPNWWKKNQTYNCPRLWRFFLHHRGPMKPLFTSQHSVMLKGLKGVLNWASIMPRDYARGCRFWQFGIRPDPVCLVTKYSQVNVWYALHTNMNFIHRIWILYTTCCTINCTYQLYTSHALINLAWYTLHTTYEFYTPHAHTINFASNIYANISLN